MNFRTEIWISGNGIVADDIENFTTLMKQQFASAGPAMKQVRKSLEHWVEFVNPYQRLRRSVSQLMEDISSLGLSTEQDSMPDFAEQSEHGDYSDRWQALAQKYTRATGMCFGVRSMLPVMGEAFVNLLLYILMRKEIRQDTRLRENAIRQPIDIRIRSLSINCTGFKQQVDYSSEACKKFHSLINNRNDLLHGNVVIEKLRFNELHFFGKVPVFIEYSSMWERTLGVAHRAAGLALVTAELSVVDDLITYILSCLDEKTRQQVEFMSKKFDLGICQDNGRLGVLFGDVLHDFSMQADPSDKSASAK